MSTMSGGPNIVTNGLVLHLDAANTKSFRGIPTTNLLSNPTQILTTNEFGQYYNLASIFDTNGLVLYSLSFDMKVNKNGNVLVYMQNGSYTKYSFVNQTVSATTEYQRFKFENLTPSGPLADWQANTPTDNRAVLATYTVYGSGVIPTLTNFQLELGAVATPFVVGTRGTTVATGGGWADRTTNANHGELVNNPTYITNYGGQLIFNGSSNYVVTSNFYNLATTNQITATIWCKSNTSTWNDYGFLLSKRNQFLIHPTISSKEVGFFVNTTTGGWESISFTPSVEITTFNSYTLHYINGVLKIYFNGALITTSSSIGATLTSSISQLYIGRDSTLSRYFNGAVSLVTIYNRALSDSEILQNYNAQKSRFGLS